MFRLNHDMSRNIWRSLRGNKAGAHWEDIVGYTIDQLKQHLESLFQFGMNWSNHDLCGWHIDHIKPVSLFDFKSYKDDQFKQCWALDNLQPLWAMDNLKKSNKYKRGE